VLGGQDSLKIDERIFFVDHVRDFAESAFCIEGSGSGGGVEGIEANGVGGPRAGDGLRFS